ncbi:MAG: ABC transporter permease [Anaerolineales bacterium]|jgi:ABC-type multidrug transport system permease subunit
MKRFRLLLVNEFKLFRTAIPVHLIGIFQPALMFSLMALILVHPTFDMRIVHPTSLLGEDLVAAMDEVGSPIGTNYINTILVDQDPSGELPGGQLIRVESIDGKPVAVQRFGFIDSNIIKNYRNRLTSAALRLWNATLGGKAVTIEQRAWLPSDVPYSVYFGMAMLPLAAFLASSLIGAFLTAQEFEFNTILEYRLSPVSTFLILGTRLLRLCLTGWLSATVLTVIIRCVVGVWPSSILGASLIFLSMGLLGGCLGIAAGLILRSTLPAFVIGLGSTFFTWILGSAFGLSAGFGGAYEAVSRWMPNTYAVELLFPLYYGVDIGPNRRAILVLCLACLVMILLTSFIYRRRVLIRHGRQT